TTSLTTTPTPTPTALTTTTTTTTTALTTTTTSTTTKTTILCNTELPDNVIVGLQCNPPRKELDKQDMKSLKLVGDPITMANNEKCSDNYLVVKSTCNVATYWCTEAVGGVDENDCMISSVTPNSRQALCSSNMAVVRIKKSDKVISEIECC
ncbi:hypothetical protein Hamer_G017357, partial [Homarus americanus]